MANPLARVVMNSIAQKSGKVGLRPNNVGSSTNTNLGRTEVQLLSNLINKSGSVTNVKSSSYDKNAYGRSSKVVNPLSSMQTLDSLASKKNIAVESSNVNETNQVNVGFNTNTNIGNLSTLNTLGNVNVGGSNVNRGSNRNVMQKVSLGDLVSGKSNVEKKEVRTSYTNQQSSITSLGDLANKMKKVSDDNNTVEKSTSNSYVKSNVLSNLEAYIPKVTLDSIGKKGSLF